MPGRSRQARPLHPPYSTQTNALPIFAMWKSGAGHDVWHDAPVHDGSTAFGNV